MPLSQLQRPRQPAKHTGYSYSECKHSTQWQTHEGCKPMQHALRFRENLPQLDKPSKVPAPPLQSIQTQVELCSSLHVSGTEKHVMNAVTWL